MENFAPGSGSKASSMTSTARILIIAGSDSGGGAGIQADIKTVTMLGGHAMTAVTAVTAQNTVGVSAVHPVPTEMILAQIDAVVERHRSRRGQDRHDRRRLRRRAGREPARAASGRTAGPSDRLRSGDGRDQRRRRSPTTRPSPLSAG